MPASSVANDNRDRLEAGDAGMGWMEAQTGPAMATDLVANVAPPEFV